MNKYIRTKEKIYEACENGETYNGFGCKIAEGTIKIHKDEIIKQSDIIEQLFDEFVFVDEFGKKDLLDDNYKAELQECGTFSVVHAMLKQDRPKELYGAIWTDKGLIYVAKMNERLEMELL